MEAQREAIEPLEEKCHKNGQNDHVSVTLDRWIQEQLETEV